MKDNVVNKSAGKMLRQAIQASLAVISGEGPISVDFQDVQKIVGKSGEAFVGVGRTSDAGKLLPAVVKAVDLLKLKCADIKGAGGILINFTSSSGMKSVEINKALEYLSRIFSPEAFIRYGMVIDKDLGNEMLITIIAVRHCVDGSPSGS